MEWRFEGGGPIYAQIVAAVKLAVASGELRPGERVPGVRELALEAGVNPNTMQRAMAELEREGLLYSQRTAGRFVTEDAGTVAAARRELAEGYVRTFLDAMRRLGLKKDEIHKLLEAEKEEQNAGTGM